ncbi:glycoside hydrolase family 38 C-terminal domain-containing protein [Lactobacillus sp. ESL0681]|uniref:glycoside hydrolase family 38 N-terminal domain-containing protein n=1 Tax=Lactobacillus sp. ESL0681 TaxID=2983211 RepID=UPI0023F6DF64|nr:glycoside hydrolase family 38 C-terminal domain-containing protein [Lactobacillus sp. ESL0681]WEV39631.1 alpha-mannosidase [Lactobacillus sp. ESL0681]
MVKAYFVNHTHWDREWYFTTQDAQVLSDQLFTQVLDELEEHPEANFTLDGQMSIIDDYVEIHPEAKSRIHNLVERKQLFIGPWYTQTDALIPNAESLVRNLIIGILDAKENFGEPMMLGYLPDTFGFNANLPMILNQVGIHDFLSWRGTNFKRQANSVYFKWKALGGKAVFAANFPLGYYTGQIDLESKNNLQDFVKNRLDQGIEFEALNGHNAEVLVPSGIDQMNIIHNISETITEVNKYSKNELVISTYPEFMAKLHQKDLPEYQGELRYPTYSRVHRTISSVRSRNKRNNFKLEQIITRRLEPLMVIAKFAKVPISNGIVIKLWKLLFNVQPHDTLGGSVTDNVAEDINHRFKQAFEIADGVENYIKKRIAQSLALSDHDVMVFNTDPYEFNGRKIVEIISSSENVCFPKEYDAVIVAKEEVPPRPHIMQLTPNGYEFKDEPGYFKLKVSLSITMAGLGYRVIHFEDSESSMPALEQVQGDSISNDNVKLIFKDGKFKLINKNQVFTDIISIYDQANDGDTYDFSPLIDDSEMRLPWNGKLKKTSSADIEQLVLSGEWQIPATLADRVKQSDKDMAVIKYKLVLSLSSTAKIVAAKLKIDNQAFSHRLRLRLKTGINTEFVHAQIQGGFTKTKNIPIADNWNDEFVEKPVNIYIFDRYVGLKDAENGLYFLGKGQKEYERVDDALYITLMATTGELGKPDLLWRPGRASGDTTSVGHVMMPTPMAQEIGINEFEFGLYAPCDEELSEDKLSQEMNHWYSPSVSYQMQQYNLFVNRLDNKLWDIENPTGDSQLGTDETWLTIIPDVEVSALYPAYTLKDHLVLRLSNMTEFAKDMSYLKDQGYIQVDGLEQTVTQSFKIQPYDMITMIKKI